MRSLVLVSMIAFMATANIGLYAQVKDTAQVEPKVKLELLYKKDFNELLVGPKQFPPPEIKKVLKQKDVPQEDKDWLLNALRIEIARREKVLYTNDKQAIKLPEDLKSIITSKNLKYMIAYTRHYEYGKYSEDEATRIGKNAREAFDISIRWQFKYEKADEKNKERFRDSLLYWARIRDSLGVITHYIERNTKEISKSKCMETKSGKILWEKEIFTKPRRISISNNGKVTIAVIGSGPYSSRFKSIIFLDENGEKKKEVTGLSGLADCHAMSPDGEMFCAIIEIDRKDPPAMAVAAYDKNGNELWVTELPGTNPRSNEPQIAISPNCKHVAVSLLGQRWWREAHTYLIDNKGVLINTYNCRTWYPGFSSDDKYVILGTPRDTIYFVQTENGAVLWKKYLGDRSAFYEPAITTDGRAIFFYSKQNGGRPAYFLDKNGDIIWNGTQELKNSVGFSPNGYFFVPGTIPNVIIYKVSVGGAK